MTDELKLFERIRDGRKNVRLNDLIKLMKKLGFEIRETKHSIWFTHPEYNLRASTAKHKEKGQENKVHSKYVDNCLDTIDELLLIKGEKNEK